MDVSRVLLLVVLSACLAPAAPLSPLKGTVADATGAAIAGARITLTSVAQTLVAATESNAEGRFQFERVPNGRYLLRAEKAGFAELTRAVGLPAAGELALQLKVGPARTEITISAEASSAIAVENSPQPVTVIPRQQLDQQVDVISAAAEGAGVQQLRTSSTLGAFFVRGLTGSKVATYRDGIRYSTSAQRGGISTFTNLIEPESVDSIEVLRGPNSAQYGSDSMGGTVALVSSPVELTPSGQAWHGQIAPFYYSAANAFGASSRMMFATPRFGFTNNMGGRRFNTLRTGGAVDSHAAVTRFLGLPSNIFGERLADTAFTSYGGSFHSQVQLTGTSQLVGHYERSQQDGGKRYDQLLGGDGNWIADLRNLMLDFGYLRYQKFAAGPFDQFSVSTSYNAQREERVNQGGNGNPSGTITHQYEKTKVWGLQFQLDKRIRRLDWMLGGEGYREMVAAPSFTRNPTTQAIALVRPRIPDGARYLMHGVYTQASWQPLPTERLRISGAVRWGGASYSSRAANSPVVNGRWLWPDDSLAANALTGRAGAVAWLTDTIGVHTHYSRGFRVPNITDLGTLGLQGNGAYEAAVADLAGRNALIGDRADDLAQSTGKSVEKLRPEVTDNVDYGVRVRHSRLNASLSGFWMRLDNSIVSQTLLLPQGVVGQALGEQTISRQLASGAVFVPTSNSPVLVRANFSGARMRGVEQALELRLGSWRVAENLTYVYAEDARTGLPPDIEPGIPPLTVNPSLAYRPDARRFWFEIYSTLAARQERLSSLALSDRRVGNPRSRSSIQAFFNNGARTRGLVANGILIPTGETLAQVQTRVLGTANSAPQFPAIAGYGLIGLRGGYSIGERTDVIADFSNIGDKNYRGIGWGIDGPGRGIMVRVRHRF